MPPIADKLMCERFAFVHAIAQAIELTSLACMRHNQMPLQQEI
jgi:hypothetical protein